MRILLRSAALGLCSILVAALSSAPAAEPPGAAVSASATTPFLRTLGTAQDGGFPHAACACDRCSRARREPGFRRYIASLALVLPTDGRTFLFDATPDLRPQLRALEDVTHPPTDRVDRQPLEGVFLTHAHIGHYLGLAFFGYEAIHTKQLEVYVTPRMAEFLSHNGPWSQLIELDNVDLRVLAAGQGHAVGQGVTVTAVKAPHRDEYADTLGYLIRGPHRSVFYLPDTDSWVAWPTPITALLAEVDIALLDGTFFSAEELPGRRVEEIGHPLIEQSMNLLQDLVDRQGLEVYFTHLNHSNPAVDPDSAARRRIEDRGFHVLEEGQEFPL